jgi:hypothetical protein
MTDQELKKLRDLCEKATPGPWKNDCGNGQVETEDLRVVICNREGGLGRLEDCLSMYCRECEGDIFEAAKELPEEVQQLLKYDNEDDMEFIAEARTAIPKLLDEVESLKEENARLINERDQLREKLAMAEDFIGWLTPCGQVNVSPTITVIGQTARQVLAKIIGEK